MAKDDHKYTTGDYMVLMFNAYGSRVAERKETSWIRSKLRGEEWVEDARAASFVIIRTVYNSLDGHPTTVGNLEEVSE